MTTEGISPDAMAAMAAQAAGQQPIAMTKDQFEALGTLITSAHEDSKNHQRLVQAAAGIDRCDGLVPDNVRTWLRAMDGWQTEAVTDEFMVSLAKATTTGELLEEIRACCNVAPPHGIDDWTSLREHVVEHFLSACENIKLQAKLETIKQRMGEATPTYIRRFRTDALRAYGTSGRAATEEARVVASFLRGLANRQFAERLFRSGKVGTLQEVIAVALEKEAERERMEQVLRSRGEEPMEVAPVDSTTKLLGTLDTVQRRLDQVTNRLNKVEGSAKKEAEKPKPQRQEPRPMGRRSSRPDHRWNERGQPICNYCGFAGHLYRECPKRQQANATAKPASDSIPVKAPSGGL